VICIKDYNNGGWLPKDYSLTKGQLYEVSNITTSANWEKGLLTIEGKGNVNYPTNLFITVEQHRENQLNKILYENNNTIEMEIPKMASQTKSDFLQEVTM
jgi:hypothetical protein